MRHTMEKDLRKTAQALCAEVRSQPAVEACSGAQLDHRCAPRARTGEENGGGTGARSGQHTGPTTAAEARKQALATLVETRLVSAAWTLRRLPDRERAFLHMRGSLWPETRSDAGSYPAAPMSSLAARRRTRISAAEIDQMQPALDLLTLLPDKMDRQVLFWGAWHQDGETGGRIPWAKVRRSLGAGDSTGGGLSRWTLKRRYNAGLQWLASLIALQAE